MLFPNATTFLKLKRAVQRVTYGQWLAAAGSFGFLSWHWIYVDLANAQYDYMGFRVFLSLSCLLPLSLSTFQNHWGRWIKARLEQWIYILASAIIVAEMHWLIPHNAKSSAHPIGVYVLISLCAGGMRIRSYRNYFFLVTVLSMWTSDPDVWPVSRLFHASAIGCLLLFGEIFQKRAISEQQQTQDQLDLNQQIEAISRVGGFRLDLITNKFWLSPGAQRILMPLAPKVFTHNELSVDEMKKAVPGLDTPEVRAAVDELSQKGVRKTLELDLTQNDSPLWLRVSFDQGVLGHQASSQPNATAQFGIVFGGVSDITDLKLTELEIKRVNAQMMQASKLSALGEMAGGIAHEINNPMQIISTASELLLDLHNEKTLKDEMLVKNLEKIHNTSNRVAKIIKGLKLFSRDSSTQDLGLADVKDIVQETLGFCLERYKAHDIALEVIMPQLACPVLANSVQLSQVFLNIMNNAFDAIQENIANGLIPKTANPQILIWTQIFEEKISVAISNTGPRIPEKVVKRMFEPFFTTKEVGKGTGLGLSVSKGIVELHGGRIFLDPESVLTRFVIELPTHRLVETAKAA